MWTTKRFLAKWWRVWQWLRRMSPKTVTCRSVLFLDSFWLTRTNAVVSMWPRSGKKSRLPICHQSTPYKGQHKVLHVPDVGRIDITKEGEKNNVIIINKERLLAPGCQIAKHFFVFWVFALFWQLPRAPQESLTSVFINPALIICSSAAQILSSSVDWELQIEIVGVEKFSVAAKTHLSSQQPLGEQPGILVQLRNARQIFKHRSQSSECRLLPSRFIHIKLGINIYTN